MLIDALNLNIAKNRDFPQKIKIVKITEKGKK